MSESELEPLAPGSARFTRELARAERLFAARQYTAARENFGRLRPHATGDASELVPLHLGECDYYLRRLRGLREDLRPFLDGSARRAEARILDLMIARELGRRDKVSFAHEGPGGSVPRQLMGGGRPQQPRDLLHR